jgi:opacity protein-like surface antigen
MRTRVQLARAQRFTFFYMPFGGLIGRCTGRISPYAKLGVVLDWSILPLTSKKVKGITMKTKFYAALLSTLVSIPAFADLGNIYASGKVGWGWMDLKDVDESSGLPPSYAASEPSTSSISQGELAYGGAVGLQWNAFLIPIRTEVDYTYRNHLNYNTDFLYQNNPKDGSSLESTVQSQTLLGNLYFDLPLTQLFSLFIGGGAGVAFNTTNTNLYIPVPALADTESTTDEFGFAWIFTAGASLTPTEWLAIDLSYRYSDLGDVLWASPLHTEFSSSNFTSQDVFLSLRFTMPSEKRPPAPAPMPYKPKAEPEPIPVTKSPAYVKPETKSPSYDAERARRVKKTGDVNKDK